MGQFDAMDYLKVDKPRSLRRISRMLIVGSMTSDLQTAAIGVECFDNIKTLRDMIYSIPGESFVLSAAKLEDMHDVTKGAETCLQVANNFLEFVGAVWGADHAQALSVLLDWYDPAPGWTKDEILESISNSLAVLAVIASVIASGGTDLPAAVPWLLLIAGSTAQGIQTLRAFENGDITADERDRQLLWVGFTVILGSFGAFATGGRNISFAPGLMEGAQGQRIILALNTLTSDTIMSTSPDYQGALEQIYEFMNAHGIPNSQVDLAIAELKRLKKQSEELGDQFHIDIPSGVPTHTIPTYEGPAGSTNLPFDVTTPYEAGPEGIGITQPGDLNKAEVEQAVRDHPDYSAWLRARESEYVASHKGSSPHDFYESIVNDGIRKSVDPGVQVPLLYEKLIFAVIQVNRQ